MKDPSKVRNSFLDKKMLGTLFQEEEITKKDNQYNQIARDDKGHKRFHGAFEGGIEAGYHNTVGSREGWAPQKFYSTRTNRAQIDKQNIESFMDDEDLGKRKLGINITICADFDTYGVNEVSALKQSLGAGTLLGDVPEDLVYRDNRSIGYTQLMKLRREKLVNNKIQAVELEEEQQPTKSVVWKSNNYFNGIGYKFNASEQSQIGGTPLEQTFNAAIKKITAPMAEEEEEIKRQQDNKMRMDGSIKEDKEEFLKYIEQDDQHIDKPRKQIKGLTKNIIFIKDPIPLRMDSKEYYIDVPQSYDPYLRAKNLLKEGVDQYFIFIQKNTNKKASQLHNVTVPRKQLFSNEKDIQIQRDQHKSKFVKASVQILGSSIPQPQTQVEVKVKIEDKPETKAEQQKEQEIPMPNEPIKVDPLFSRRTQKRWIPEDMFCKRLGVPQPYSKEEMALIFQVNERIECKQPNMATDTNRDFLRMDKKVFIPGGIYLESNEDKAKISDRQFDPTQLGLPLSFKSSSNERLQRDQFIIIQNQLKAQGDGPKQYKKSDKYKEDQEPALPERVNNQSLFDFIFGDDENQQQ